MNFVNIVNITDLDITDITNIDYSQNSSPKPTKYWMKVNFCWRFSFLFLSSLPQQLLWKFIIKRTLLKKAIQAKISSLKWKGILYNNRQIQQGVGQLSTINHSWVKEVFLESIMLLFGQIKYTNMGTFFSKQEFLFSKKYEQVQFQVQWLQHIFSKS